MPLQKISKKNKGGFMINKITNETNINQTSALQKSKDMGRNIVEESQKRLGNVPKTLEEENKGKNINTQA